MTPARKAALQCIHDLGGVRSLRGLPITGEMLNLMIREGQVQWCQDRLGGPVFTLTDKGRRALHGDKE